MIQEQDISLYPNHTWYLDFYASKYLTNNQNSFTKTRIHHLKFLITKREIMILEKENIVTIQIRNRKIFELRNVVYTSIANSNLVFFGQL